MATISKREDVKPSEGTSKYGDVAFADEKNKKYPIDTEEHIRAAWNYINKEGNAGKYDSGEVATIKKKIIAAWKDKIDPKGPPSAAPGKSVEMSLADALLEAAIKAGARHNSEDRASIQAVHDHACKLGAKCDAANTEQETPEEDAGESSADEAAGKSLTFETLVAYGGSVKSLPGGHVGGYLVRFSSPSDPDLTGDYFTKDTDFGIEPGARTKVYFNHAQPLYTAKGKPVRVPQAIGEGTLSIDEGGVLIDAILTSREQYERDILSTLDEQGWSSGTASHLVERKRVGRANWVSRWPLGLDASLTPTPAEPRNAAVPLKSLIVGPGQAEPDGADDDSDLLAEAASIVLFAEVLE